MEIARMARSARVQEFLRSVDTPLADEALTTAIRKVTPEEVTPLAETLLARGRPTAYRALVECYDVLTPELQQRVTRQCQEVLPAVAEVLGSGQSQPRVNA